MCWSVVPRPGAQERMPCHGAGFVRSCSGNGSPDRSCRKAHPCTVGGAWRRLRVPFSPRVVGVSGVRSGAQSPEFRWGESMSSPSLPGQVPADAGTAAEENDLQASLTALSRLSTGRLDLEDLLVQVATFAVQAIPGADGAGLTMMERDRADTIVASAPFVREIDAIQYGIGEGPCISAAAEGATMRSGSLGGEPRWPRFGPRAGRLGVHSVLSLPLLTPDGVFGAMNVYAHGKDAFDEQCRADR